MLRHACVLLMLTPAAAIVSPPATIVVLGPGSSEVQLLVAKRAAGIGYRVQHVTRAADIPLNNRLMFGTRGAAENPPLFAVANSQIANALSAAEGLVLCVAGGSVPPSTSGIATLLPYAPRLRRIALLSAIGGSSGSTGGLGEGELIREREREVASLAAAAGVGVSTVRVGVLKGGAVAAAEQSALGLDAATYYASLTTGGYPTPSQQCAKLYDARTLGVTLTAGDGVAARNAMLRASTRTSDAPCADEVSRVTAAGALLAALRHPTALEVSLSAAEGGVTPSDAEWDARLATLATLGAASSVS